VNRASIAFMDIVPLLSWFGTPCVLAIPPLKRLRRAQARGEEAETLSVWLRCLDSSSPPTSLVIEAAAFARSQDFPVTLQG